MKKIIMTAIVAVLFSSNVSAKTSVFFIESNPVEAVKIQVSSKEDIMKELAVEIKGDIDLMLKESMRDTKLKLESSISQKITSEAKSSVAKLIKEEKNVKLNRGIWIYAVE